MNKSVERITLDVQNSNELVTVELNQGSDTAKRIEITLTDGGFPYKIAEGCHAVFAGLKPDNHVIFNRCEIENDTIIYDVTPQTTAAAGKMPAQVRVYGADNTVLTSARFLIYVNSAVVPNDLIASSSEFSELSLVICEATTVIENANEAAYEARQAAQQAVQPGASGGNMTVYCWGDSLTEGVGGSVKQAEGIFIYPEYSYPKTLAESYPVVNCGARGENIPSIMARQGADPIVVGGFTIPADRTPVKIGELNLLSGVGLKTRSGATAQILKESEGSGINPVTISGVKGTLYRQLENHFDGEHTYGYFFVRELPGDAVAVPENTEVVTHAMQNFRNGIAVIWMGANGGCSGHTDYIGKLNAMIQYGNYRNYLIILSREFMEPWRTAIKNEFTDEDGVCHVIDLLEELPARGYMLAGLCFNSPDTSSWGTTDIIKKKAPLLCEYISGQTGENAYGALHYSAWGYKAIGKLVREKLESIGTAVIVSTSGEDHYGAYLYKLPTKKALKGNTVIDTKVKLFDDKDKSWTVVCVFDGTVTSAEGWPAQILSCNYDGRPGLLARYYSEEGGLFVGVGAGGVDSSAENVGWESHNRNGLNCLIVVKNGDNYSVFLNGGLAYGAPLGYGITAEQQHELTLIAGARYSAEGAKQYYTSVTIKQLIVYESALGKTAVEEMTQAYLSGNTPGGGTSGGGTSGGDTPGGNIPGGDTPDVEQSNSGEDKYGSYSYKLPNQKALTGTSIIDTKIKLYDDKDRNWTVVCVFDGVVKCDTGYPYMILSCNYDGSPGLYARYASEEDGLFVGAGTGGVNSNSATNWENHNRNGLNVLIAVKSGDNYSLFLNGGLAYGAPLGYGITAEQQHELTLIAGARYSADGAKQYYTSVTIKQLIVYNEALANSAVEEMTQTFLSET